MLLSAVAILGGLPLVGKLQLIEPTVGKLQRFATELFTTFRDMSFDGVGISRDGAAKNCCRAASSG